MKTGEYRILIKDPLGETVLSVEATWFGEARIKAKALMPNAPDCTYEIYRLIEKSTDGEPNI